MQYPDNKMEAGSFPANFTLIDDATAYTNGTSGFSAIMILNDTVAFNVATTKVGNSVKSLAIINTNIANLVGSIIYGNFTTVQLTAGAVLAYRL
jgi:hypothetical protein